MCQAPAPSTEPSPQASCTKLDELRNARNRTLKCNFKCTSFALKVPTLHQAEQGGSEPYSLGV